MPSAAQLEIESEAPAHELPKRPSAGRQSLPFGSEFLGFFGDSLLKRLVQNPDNLTVANYRSMIDRDDAVKWAVKYSSLCIMSNWQPYENENRRVYNYVNEMLDRCETSLMDWGEEACSAKWAGFSVTEMCLYYDEGRLWVKELPLIDPNLDFVMDQDPASPTYGRPAGIRQHKSAFLLAPTMIPADRLIIHTNNGLFGNPYGTSDLKSAFAKFIGKEALFLQWGRTLEKYGTPLTYAQSDGLDVTETSWLNDATVTRADNILDMLTRLGEDGVGALPKDIQIEFLEMKQTIGQDFERYENFCTKSILRSWLISSILSESSDVGSFALGEKHFEVFLANAVSDTRKLQRSLMRYLIAPLIRWNFGPNVPLGGFAKPQLSRDERQSLANIFFSLTNAGYMSPGARADSDFVRDKVGLKPCSDQDLAAAKVRHESKQSGAGENLPGGQAPDGLRGTDPGAPNPTPQTPGQPQGRSGRQAA